MDVQPWHDVVESAVNFRVIDGGNEGRLGFTTFVLREFAFLLQLGFSVAREESTLVRFETERIFVNVYHGRSSYAVGVELGRIQQGDMYSLHEVLAAVSPADVDQARFQASDPGELERCLSRVASTIKEKCRALLTGDEAAFVELHSIVAPMRQAATMQAQFGAILTRGDQAWDSKDWATARALYERAEPGLSDSQRRRLEFLRKRGK